MEEGWVWREGWVALHQMHSLLIRWRTSTLRTQAESERSKGRFCAITPHPCLPPAASPLLPCHPSPSIPASLCNSSMSQERSICLIGSQPLLSAHDAATLRVEVTVMILTSTINLQHPNGDGGAHPAQCVWIGYLHGPGSSRSQAVPCVKTFSCP